MHTLDSAWDTVTREFDAERKKSSELARSQNFRELNQLLRRFQQYRTEAEWTSAVLDGLSTVSQVALFEVLKTRLCLRGQKGLTLPETWEFLFASSPAFSSCLSTKETVVAMRTPSEVTEALASPEPSSRAYIAPIHVNERVVAVIFASDRRMVDVNALELIAGLASMALERRINLSIQTQIQPATPIPSTDKTTAKEIGKSLLPDLDERQQTLHLRAQRFARVRVAEIQIRKPAACISGREQGNLFTLLQPEIDAAREAFRKQFMTIPSMIDYLHLELVSAAANGDEMKLGAEYPGQLL